MFLFRRKFTELILNQKALTRGRTEHFSDILADRELSAGCYLQFPIQICFSATVP